MLQILPIDFAELKEGNNPENLLNEFRQIVYSKEINNNIIKLIQIENEYYIYEFKKQYLNLVII